MSLVAVVSAGCRELAGLVDAVVSGLALVLRLNFLLASWVVAGLSAAVSALLLLLDRAATVLYILTGDGLAFLDDVGGALCALADAAGAAGRDALAAVWCALRAVAWGVGGTAAALATAGDAVTGAAAALRHGVVHVASTLVGSLVLVYQTTVLVLTMVPWCIAYTVLYCFQCLDNMQKAVVDAVISGCRAFVGLCYHSAHSLVSEVLNIPWQAVLGGVVVLLAICTLRALVKLLSGTAVPARRVAALSTFVARRGSRVAAALVRELRGRACPLAAWLGRTGRQLARWLRRWAVPCRLLLAVLLAAMHISVRGVRAFAHNVAIGLRPGAGAAGAGRVRQPLETADDRPKATTAARRPELESRSCVICQELEKTVILMPCRHVCLCQPCSRALVTGDRRCPMCRTHIDHTMRVFL